VDLRRAIRRRHAAALTIDPLIDVAAEFGTAVADSVEKSYRIDNVRAERFLKKYMSDRVEMINATTRDAIQEALESDDPRTAIENVFHHARDVRAPAIAETEVVRTSNWAAIDAGKWTAELEFKRWATQHDSKVRHEHRGLNDQIVGWNENFVSPSGYQGPGPGSMSGGANMNMRCRCAAIPARRPQATELGDYGDPVDLYEDVRAPHVEDLTRAWRRVFDEQEAAVLAELE
jgi:Phage Mu protein F like protein